MQTRSPKANAGAEAQTQEASLRLLQPHNSWACGRAAPSRPLPGSQGALGGVRYRPGGDEGRASFCGLLGTWGRTGS